LPVCREYGFPYSSLSVMDMYLNAYDPYSGLALHGPHGYVRESEVRVIEPSLKSNVAGGVQFSEWVTDPVRLSREIALCAYKRGGVIISHHEVIGFETCQSQDGTLVTAARLKNRHGDTEELQARYFINACGAWAPVVAGMLGLSVRLRPTQGSSIVIGRRLVRDPVILFDEHSHYVTIMPRGDTTVVGPTNVEISDEVARNPDLAETSDDEVASLLEVANHHLSGDVSESDIVSTKCGLRPQLNHRGVTPYSITHQFGIYDHRKDGVANFSTLVGGKLTSQLRMAKEVTELACQCLGIEFSWPMPKTSLSSSPPTVEFLKGWYHRSFALHLQGDEHQEKTVARSSGLQKVRALANLIRYGTRYPFDRIRRSR
jgi:glycerol-3-phosphate dehydrogenase